MAEEDRDEVVVVDPYIYIWLDDSIDTSKPSQEIKSCIQQIVKGRLRTFTNSDECVDYITTEITTQEIFLIVSNRLGQHVIPLIYDIPQIHTVYVFCGHRAGAEAWKQPHLKIGEIFTKKQDLIRQIWNDIRTSSGDDSVPFSVFNLHEKEQSLKKLTKESAKFMWYQSIMTLLMLLGGRCNSKDEMIAECEKCYHDDPIGRKKIDDFKNNYTLDKVFWWYTNDCFAYRLLNKALRAQNLMNIFKFRFFISDLDKEIQRLYRQYLTDHPPSHMTFYRGQFISMEELDALKNNVDQVISMNSFLSTTRKLYVAQMFFDADGQSQQTALQNVLFIIDVHDIDEETTPFAFITRQACNPDEDEVLFTIGAIFKVESVKQEKNVWHVNLKLSRLENQQHKDFSTYMRQQMGPDPSPVAFGWYLYRMGAFNKAESYAEYIIKQLSLDETEIGDAYNLLGLIYKDLNRVEKSIQYYEQALQYYSNSPRGQGSQVIAIHHNISLAYLARGNSSRAEEHRRQADALLANSSLASNPMHMNMKKDFQARLHAINGDFPRAFKQLQQLLADKRKTLPDHSPSIATTLNLMGIVLEKMNRDDEALKHFQEALNITQKALSDENFDAAEFHANIGRIYFKRKQYQLALEQFERAMKIITDVTREENDDIVVLLKCISMTQERLDPLPKK